MKDQKIEALKKTNLFSSCTNDQLALIGKVTDRASLDAGTAVVRENTVPHQMAILISGKATVEAGGHHLADLGPGDVIGELAMVDSERASATVTISDDAEAWLVARSGFKPVWEQNPEISTALLQAVVQRLRATNELVA